MPIVVLIWRVLQGSMSDPVKDRRGHGASAVQGEGKGAFVKLQCAPTDAELRGGQGDAGLFVGFKQQDG